MTAIMKKLAPALFAAGTIIAGSSLAMAAESLSVNTDQSQIITLDRAPATIVVGNPTIADVTIAGRMLFVHGRVFGKTNIIALDEAGKQLADYSVNVENEDSYNVVVFKPSTKVAEMIKESYTCVTDCEAVFHIGDSSEHYKLVHEQQKNKLSLAQGQKAGDDPANNGQTGAAAPPSN